VEKLKISGNTIPETYSLEQNYPNPFNPATTIEFSIPEDVENVKLTIYDALGQKVAELVNGKLEAGRYIYQWDASRVATGLYIYQLSSEKFTSTKKMMLMK
jgi:flagellar hook assembly protein FlgD